MVTFNEQKGQGQFQPVLSEPNGGGTSGPTVPGSGLAVSSIAIDGASNIFDILASQPLPADQPSENLVANKSDLEAELVGELSLISDSPIPGGVVRQAGEDIGRLRDAFQQGRISQTEINTRLAATVQRYIAGDPRNAETYRDLARNVLGITPSQEILAERIEQIEFERDQQREVTQSFVDIAVDKYGIAIPDGQGGINVEATAAAGQQAQQQEAKVAALKDQIAMQKMLAETSKARRLTEAEQKRIDFREFSGAVTPLIDGIIQGHYTSLQLLQQGAQAGQDEAAVQQAILEDTRQRRLAAEALINDAALQGQISPDAVEDYKKIALSTFDSTTDAIRSGFDDMEQTLEAMEARSARDLRVAAPVITRIKDAGGRDAVAAVFPEILRASGLQDQLNAEAVDIVAGRASRFADVMEGNVGARDLSTEEKPITAKVGFATIESMNRRPNALSPNQKQAYKNTTSTLIQMASDNASPQDKAVGVERLSSPFNLDTIETLRANDSDMEVVGAALRDVNAEAFVENVRRLEPTTPLMQQAKFFLTRGASTPASFQATYNAVTGRIEIARSTPTGGQEIVTEGIPSNLAKDVRRLNGNLETIVRLSDFGSNKELAKFTPNQIKQAFILSTGAVGITNEDSLEEIPGGLAGFFGIDQARPILENSDGSFSTEETITIETGGKAINIPTIVNGKRVSEELAQQLFETGANPSVGEFDTVEEAVAAAKARSQVIGEVRKGDRR